MACPFFTPTKRADNIAFPHPRRLPLGSSWRGMCSAPGHELVVPNDVDLESCNLGYAKSCPRLPQERICDAVRFGVVNDFGGMISLQFVLESGYLPTGYGLLQYDQPLGRWITRHPAERIQELAESFLRSYLERKNRQ